MIDRTRVKPGDVVQIHYMDESYFGNRLMVVDDVRPWGIQCYEPTNDGDAYYRAEWKHIARHWNAEP